MNREEVSGDYFSGGEDSARVPPRLRVSGAACRSGPRTRGPRRPAPRTLLLQRRDRQKPQGGRSVRAALGHLVAPRLSSWLVRALLSSQAPRHMSASLPGGRRPLRWREVVPPAPSPRLQPSSQGAQRFQCAWLRPPHSSGSFFSLPKGTTPSWWVLCTAVLHTPHELRPRVQLQRKCLSLTLRL